MQIKNIWRCAPLPPSLKLCYNRFTQSKITTAYFVLSLVHCIVQITLQARGLGIEHTQSVALHDIIGVSNVTAKFAILDSKSENVVLLCDTPGQTLPQPCQKFPLTLSGIPGIPPDQGLNGSCTQALVWPQQKVNQAMRESVAMIIFQAWLFGVSVVAILTESIPHVVAALVTHILSTAWASFNVERTARLGQHFANIVTNLPCQQVPLMPPNWETDQSNDLPILVLNVASLLVSGYLSRKLCKQFGVQSYTRVGGSTRIYNLYLLALVFLVSLQLATFFLIASLVLWIEQLFDGPIAMLVKGRPTFLGAFIATAVIILPWPYMGCTAVRRERRRMMLIFLCTSLLLILSQLDMFLSPLYRLTFSTWDFFAAVTTLAYILLDLSFFMAIVCRYFFGRGLAHFLQVQEVLEECNFTPVVIERGSRTFGASANDEACIMPWDVEGQGVVKKLSLLEDTNHITTDLSVMHIRPPSGVLTVSSRARSVSRVSNSQVAIYRHT
ncbi:hypothetical protein JB92DRAFT_1679405 [Gautieria morchelliformis]|nr:hypothetical protein JB92DRAFT_1679405 [Gautieria morchelliformis]